MSPAYSPFSLRMQETLNLKSPFLLSLVLHVKSWHLLPLLYTRQRRITLTICPNSGNTRAPFTRQWCASMVPS